MTSQELLEKVKGLYGFGSKSANIYVWVGTILVVFVGVSFFFMSYSLARHKSMVACLRAAVTQKDAEANVKDLEIKKQSIRIKLLELEKKNKLKVKEREELRKKIADSDKSLTAAKKKLKTDIKKMSKKSMKELLEKAEQLEKDTL